MDAQSFWIQNQKKTDSDHLRLLVMFHYIFAGLFVVGLGFLFLHYSIMHSFLENPNFINKHQEVVQTAPQDIFGFLIWFYIIFGILTVIGGVANLLSGIFIKKRKFRLYSLIVAGINCLQMPIGTALGAFTFIVLSRNSVRELYENTKGISN